MTRKICTIPVLYIMAGVDISDICNRYYEITSKKISPSSTVNKPDILKNIQRLSIPFITTDHIEYLIKGMTAVEVLNIVSLFEKNTADNEVINHLSNYGTVIETATENLTGIEFRYNLINSIANILSQKNDSAAILVGKQGVGKSTIVNGLSTLINLSIYPSLYGTTILKVKHNAIVTGTPKARPEYISYIDSIQTNNTFTGNEIAEKCIENNIILFIDDVDVLIRNQQGAVFVSTMLETYVPRGLKLLLCCSDIAYSTTFSQINGSKIAFPVFIRPLEGTELSLTLFSIAEELIFLHNIQVKDEELRDLCTNCIKLSSRYMSKIPQPAAAVRLIDAACVSALHCNSNPKDAFAVHKVFTEYMNQMKISNAIDTVKKFNKQTASKLHNKISNLKITDAHIIAALSRLTGIPLDNISTTTINSVKQFKENVDKRLFGQELASSEVTNILKRVAIGANNPHKPLAALLFMGPTGVGKTEMAKTIAESFYGSESSLLHFDMSEYSSHHDISKLIGAPAGYVGYQEGGRMINMLVNNPNVVVLLDEFEKAHPSIQNILLQVLEEGRLTDGQGIEADFRNAIIVLTSNLGSFSANKLPTVGFSDCDDEEKRFTENYIRAAEDYFTPEVLNRLTAIIAFKTLSKKAQLQLVDKHIAILTNRITSSLNQNKTEIEFTKDAKEAILELGYDPKYGGRSIVRFIENNVANTIADMIMLNQTKIVVSGKDIENTK